MRLSGWLGFLEKPEEWGKMSDVKLSKEQKARIASSHRWGHRIIGVSAVLTVIICGVVYMNEEENRRVRRRGVEAEKMRQQDNINRLVQLQDQGKQ